MTESKQQVSVLFMLFSTLFCVCPIAANILEIKQVSVLGISLTGGLIVLPISYIISDCVCEVWGFQKARLLIWTGFTMNFFFVAMEALCDWISGASYWTNEAGLYAIFGPAPCAVAVSFIALIMGSFASVYVISKMKLRDGGRHFSWYAILSTIAGESLDSLIFFPLVLGGAVPTSELSGPMLRQVVLKTLYEVITLPITIRVVKKLRQHEGEDVYDNGVNYSIWKIPSLQ